MGIMVYNWLERKKVYLTTTFSVHLKTNYRLMVSFFCFGTGTDS